MKIREILKDFRFKTSKIDSEIALDQAEAEIKVLFDADEIEGVMTTEELRVTKITSRDVTRAELAKALKKWWEEK